MGMKEAQAQIKAARKAAEEAGKAKKWAASAPAPKSPLEDPDTKAKVIGAVRRAGAKHAGLANLTDVRAELAGTGWSRAEVDTILKGAESRGWIDLKTANEKSRIGDLNDAIKHVTDRGEHHLFFATVR